jgi:hypothetical protein
MRKWLLTRICTGINKFEFSILLHQIKSFNSGDEIYELLWYFNGKQNMTNEIAYPYLLKVFCCLHLNAFRSLNTSVFFLCCFSFSFSIRLILFLQTVGFISVPLPTHRNNTSPKFSSHSVRWIHEQFTCAVHSPWNSASEICSELIYLEEMILTPHDGNICVPFGTPSFPFLQSLALYSSPLTCNYLFVDENSKRDRLGEWWICKTENRIITWSCATVIYVFNIPGTIVVRLRYIYFNICMFSRHWGFRYYWNKTSLTFISHRN